VSRVFSGAWLRTEGGKRTAADALSGGERRWINERGQRRSEGGEGGFIKTSTNPGKTTTCSHERAEREGMVLMVKTNGPQRKGKALRMDGIGLRASDGRKAPQRESDMKPPREQKKKAAASYSFRRALGKSERLEREEASAARTKTFFFIWSKSAVTKARALGGRVGKGKVTSWEVWDPSNGVNTQEDPALP